MTNSIKNYLKILNNDGIIITATDTVPAIICNALSSLAVKKIYNLKQRDNKKPIAIFCANIAMAKEFFIIDEPVEHILRIFAPGAITLILQPMQNTNLAKNLNLQDDTIALRIPNNKFLQELMLTSNTPIAATSANLSGQTMTIKEINDYFTDRVDLIELDNQTTELNASSIFKILTKDNVLELRKGPISKQQILDELADI